MCLAKGILLEDIGQTLEWGIPIGAIASKISHKTEVLADRIIFHWGQHMIFNGLEINLETMFWSFNRNRIFNSIKYIEVGDKESFLEFKRISTHLVEVFGQPTSKKEISETDKSWQWEIDEVQVRLYLFEQHCYKLHLTITKK